MAKCKIIIAEDHPIVRQGLKLIIETVDELQVVGEANDGIELLDLLKRMTPDVVVMDLAMPRMQGFEALEEIRRHCPVIRTIVLSGNLHGDNIKRAIKNGASGLVCKSSWGSELIAAINSVRKGGVYLSEGIAGVDQNTTLLDLLAWEDGRTHLSHREIQVLTLIAEGYSNRQIADVMGISIRTVEKHRSNIMEKTGCRNAVELTRYAIKNGFATIT
jgi:DNA-binding NarL/FixJ family response regulator